MGGGRDCGEFRFAWPWSLRSLPNRQILLTAQAATLNGAARDGVSNGNSLEWPDGDRNGGATTAVCTSGDFSAASSRPMIGNWTQSGIAKCTVTFALATDPRWAPGNYTGAVNLSLFTQ